MKSHLLTLTWARAGFLICASGALALTAVAGSSAASAAPAAGWPHTWYVSAAAAAGGNGSPARPFSSLSAVESAAGAGDTIVVLPAPASVAPLDGGIALKPGQKLIGAGSPADLATATSPAARLTNTTGASNSGDVVELADNTQVSNLVIDGSFRGGIYGSNVTGVDIRGNNVSGQNTSCVAGFLVLPFVAAADPPGVGTDIPNGIPNGWGGIMIDGSQGSQAISITGNYVHDGVCGDGIDVRLSNSDRAAAQITGNTITRLPQGPSVNSVLAIGLQAAGSSRLSAVTDDNSETDIGSTNADCEGLFLNANGSSVLTDSVTGNYFDHGIGGKSCNGFEDIISSGPATIDATVTGSTFTDDPGDMFQELNFGVGATAHVVLARSRLIKTTIALGNANTNNVGECIWTAATGVGDVLSLNVADSQLSSCNNGISALDNVVVPSGGAGAVKSYSIDVANSSITDDAFDGLYINNVGPGLSLQHLNIDVTGTTLSGSAGAGAVFLEPAAGSTGSASIRLNGDNITGNAGGGVQTTNYAVSAQQDWWGSPAGPAPADLTVSGAGSIRYLPFLTHPAP